MLALVAQATISIVVSVRDGRRRVERETAEPAVSETIVPAPAAAVAVPAASPNVSNRPLRVLVAEDNSVNQLVLKMLLGQAGVQPELVADGQAALDAWAREPWDLILMDVQMPLMDGPTAAALIRAEERARGSARTPIVALTANAMNHQVDECLASGMDDFVAKPIDARKLFAMVMTATARGRAGPATVRAAGGA